MTIIDIMAQLEAAHGIDVSEMVVSEVWTAGLWGDDRHHLCRIARALDDCELIIHVSQDAWQRRLVQRAIMEEK